MLDDDYSCLDQLKILCNIKVKYKPSHKSPILPLLFIALTLMGAALIFGII